jgi:N-glycosylase/DNA lyase
VVLDRLACHWDGDEIDHQHLHLSLGQIYRALAYYYAHQAGMDREIEEKLRRVERIEASLGESPLRLGLKAIARLP